MKYQNGWVKYPRALDALIDDDGLTLHSLMLLIISQSEYDGISKGTWSISINAIAKRYKASQETLRRWLKKLESRGFIKITVSNKNTKISVVNYDDYSSNTNELKMSRVTSNEMSNKKARITKKKTETCSDDKIHNELGNELGSASKVSSETLFLIEGRKEEVKNNHNQSTTDMSIPSLPTEIKKSVPHSIDTATEGEYLVLTDPFNELTKSDIPKKQSDDLTLAEYWNATLPRHRQINMTLFAKDERTRRAIKKLIKEVGIDIVKQAIDEIPLSSHLRGESDGGWMPDFEWITKISNMQKVVTKKYRDKGHDERVSRTRILT